MKRKEANIPNHLSVDGTQIPGEETQLQIDKLAKEAKRGWWKKNKKRLMKANSL